jgi:hypothetical protein
MTISTDFVRALWPAPADGFLTLTAMAPDRQQATPSRHIPIHDHDHLNEAIHRLDQTNQMGWHALLGIASRQTDLGRWQRGGRDQLTALPALFVDIDQPPPQALPRLRAFRPLPSCVVASGRGIHAYWFLRQPTTDWTIADQCLRELARQLQGDSLSVAQSMRLPGSINPKVNLPSRILHLDPTWRYDLADFPQGLPDPARTPIQPLGPHRLNARLVAAISRTLLTDYKGRYKRNGWIASLCPYGHRHDSPGQHFNFNPEIGLGYCFGRHGHKLLRNLCVAVGIDPADYGGIWANRPRF